MTGARVLRNGPNKQIPRSVPRLRSGQARDDKQGVVACIGIDLAWSERNPSGLALLHFDPRRGSIELLETCCLQKDNEILHWVQDRRRSVTVLGIDAPLIAPNPAGTSRAGDRQLTRAFGRFHAGTYPANRSKCVRPIHLRKKLERLGFNPNPTAAPRQAGSWQLEVFPHPAQVVLFKLPRILKYKKGPAAARRAGLEQLAAHIQRDLPRLRPRLVLNSALRQLCRLPSFLRGRALKDREDQLDALVCGYVAAYYWRWGGQRCQVFGDVRKGYIVCPVR